MEDWIDGYRKEVKGKESTETDESSQASKERAQRAQQTMDEEWAGENGVNQETMEEFRKIEREVAPYLDELSKLWRDIVLGSSKEISKSREGYYKTGELSIPRVVKEWPSIAKGDLDSVRVMERMVDKENLVQKPELIRVRIVGDLSGSMFEIPDSWSPYNRGVSSESPKLRILRQAIVLILSSLNEFNTYLNMNRQSTRSKLQVDTEVWVFGSTSQKIKDLRSQAGVRGEQVQIVETLPYLRQNLGGTYDSAVFEEIEKSLTSADREKIKNGKIMEIVIEITDGAPSAPNATTKRINELGDIGVIVRGFQIGDVDVYGRDMFETTWNSGEKKRGEVVGADIGALIPAITKALKEYLKNVRL